MTEPTVEQKEQKFLEQQYTALRTEVENASDRAFKIFAASVLVVPTGLTLGAAGGSHVLPLIKLLLPLLLLAFYAMYWAQILSTYRTGLYIQSHIEPRLLDRAQGWESWVSERRYAYDAQVLIAFFLLSSVYFLGSVYIAVTAKVDKNPALIYLKDFLNNVDQESVTLLSHQAEKHAYELMLFVFYVLAGFVVIFLVQLTPKRELEEDRKLEQIIDEETPGKEDAIQRRFEQHLKNTMKNTKHLFRQKSSFGFTSFKGRIKHSVCYKDSITGTSPAWHMRLTIRKGFLETLRHDPLPRLVASITGVVLVLWAYTLLERIYYRLAHDVAHKPDWAIEWLPPPGSAHMLIELVALFLLSVLPLMLYHSLIGKKLGTKVTIKVLPAKDQPPDGPMTRYIVRTSLKDEHHKKATKDWVKNSLELDLLKTHRGDGLVNLFGHELRGYTGVEGKDGENSDLS